MISIPASSDAHAPELFTIKEVAARLKISERLVYTLRNQGKLKAVYLTPNLPRFTAEAIADCIAALETK